jgi:hypothetical protein
VRRVIALQAVPFPQIVRLCAGVEASAGSEEGPSELGAWTTGNQGTSLAWTTGKLAAPWPLDAPPTIQITGKQVLELLTRAFKQIDQQGKSEIDQHSVTQVHPCNGMLSTLIAVRGCTGAALSWCI